MTKRTISIALAATAAGALAGPPVVAAAKDAAQQVFVTNTAENPVITESTGTTTVGGTVGLAEGTRVRLADGSVVGLADGASVSLADNTTVKIGNTDADPAPVRIVGGGGGSAEPARQVMSFRSDVLIPDNLTRTYGQSYTVPEGKTLVVTHASGHATEQIRRIELERRSCHASGDGLYQYGILSGSTDNERVWHMPGEWSARGGCELVPAATHTPGQGADRASFHFYGYLIDE